MIVLIVVEGTIRGLAAAAGATLVTFFHSWAAQLHCLQYNPEVESAIMNQIGRKLNRHKRKAGEATLNMFSVAFQSTC